MTDGRKRDGHEVPRRVLLWGAVALLLWPGAAGADFQEMKRAGVLRVITDDDPSAAFDNELMEGFLKLHGLRVEPVRKKALAERIPTLLSGDADVAIMLFDTPERRKQVSFTVEVLPAVYTMATCRPQPPVTTVVELRARRVGVMVGSIMEGAAQRVGVPPGNIVGLPEITILIESLCANRITAALVAMPDLTAYRRKFPGLEYGAPMEGAMSASWAIRKEDRELKAALDDYLNATRRGGGWSRLIVKYYGAEALKVLGRVGSR